MTDWQLTAQQAVTRYGALQDPYELAMLLALLESREPLSVVEIGTWAGGLTWALDQLSTVQRIVTVDKAPQPGADRALSNRISYTTLITSDSRMEATAQAISAALGSPPLDVVIIDGDHSYQAARRDWDLYASMVRPGGLAVLHDTQGFPGRPDVEVPKLWAEVRQARPSVEIVRYPGGPYGTGIAWL